jgi:hypothetical protein
MSGSARANPVTTGRSIFCLGGNCLENGFDDILVLKCSTLHLLQGYILEEKILLN